MKKKLQIPFISTFCPTQTKPYVSFLSKLCSLLLLMGLFGVEGVKGWGQKATKLNEPLSGLTRNLRSYLLKISLLLLVGIIGGNSANAQTITFTGNTTDFTTPGITALSSATGNVTYYASTDGTYMYFGAFRNTNNTWGATDHFNIYVDADPRSAPTTAGNGSTTGLAWDNQTPTMPFRADYRIAIRTDGATGSGSGSSFYHSNNTTSGTANWSSTTAANAKGYTQYVSNANNGGMEIRVPLSDFGNPASTYISMFASYSGGGGGFFGPATGTFSTNTLSGYLRNLGVYKTTGNLTAGTATTPITDLSISTSGNITGDFGDITISTTATGTLTTASSFSGSLTLSGTSTTLALGTLTLNVGGRGFGGTAGQIAINNTAATPINGTSTAGTVNFLGAGVINGTSTTRAFGSTSTVAISGGVDFTGSATNIGGNLQINANGFVNTNPPTYNAGSTLIYNSGSTYGVGTEWTAGVSSGAGYPSKVTIGNGAASSALSLGSSNYSMGSNLTFSNNTGAALTMGTGTLTIGGNWVNDAPNSANFTNGGGTVALSGASTISGSNTTSGGYTFNNLILNGATTLTRQPTVNGTLTMNSVSSIVTQSPAFGASSTLVYARSGAAGLEWPASSGPNSVTLNASIGTITLNTAKVVNGTLTINSSAILDVSGSSYGLTIGSGGTFSNSGTFTAQSGTVTFNGSATISGSSTISLNNFSFANGALITMNNTLSATGGFTMGSGASYTFAFGSTSNTFTCGAITTTGSNTLTITGTGTPVAPFITSSTLSVTASTSLSLGTSTRALQINGGLTINTGATFTLASTASGGDLYVTGDISNSGTFTNGTRAVFLNGSSLQTISGSWSGTNPSNTFAYLFVNNAANAALGTNVTINNNLTFTSGKFVLNTFNLTLNSGATISTPTSAKYVQTNSTGRLVQSVSTAAITFPVGNSAYNPIILTTNTGTDVLSVLVNDVAASSGTINNANALINRNWSVTRSTTNAGSIAVTAQWNSAEEGSQFIRAAANRYVALYNTSTWATNVPSSVGGSDPYTYTTSSNLAISTNTTITITCASDDAFAAVPVISSISPTTVTAGISVTITGRNLLNPTSVTFFSNKPATVNSSSATQILTTVPSGAATGSLVVLNGSGSASSPYTYVTGKVTAQAGDWNTTSTWSGGTVPTSGDANIIISHAVTLAGTASGVSASSLTVSSGASLTTGASAAITIASISNSGTVDMTSGGIITLSSGGSFANNGTFTRGSGKIAFLGSGSFSGTISLTDVDVAGAVSLGSTATVNGTLQLKSGGSISNGGAPIFASGSILNINTGGAFSLNPGNSTTTESAGWFRGVASTGSAQQGIPWNVTIGASTIVTYDAANATFPRYINGYLSVVSTGSFTLGGGTGADLYIRGNFSNSGTFNTNSRAIFFNGASGTQTITASSTQSFDFLGINGGSNVQLNSTDVNVTASTANPLLLTSGSLDLNGKTLTLTGGGGSVSVGTGSYNILSTTGTGNLVFNGSNSITATNSGSLVLTSSVKTTINAGVDFGASNRTAIYGTLQINTGGSCSTNSPQYGPASTLIYATGNYSTSNEWVSGTNTGAAAVTGVPFNVTVNSSGTVSLAGARSVGGSLTLTAGILTVGANTLTISGSSPTRNTGYIDATNTSATVAFTNTLAISLPSGIFNNNINNLTINGSGGVSLGANLTVAGILTLTSGKLAIGSNTLTLNGTVSSMTASNSLSTTTSSVISIGGTGTLGTLFFDASNNSLNNLVINRTSTGLVTLGNALKLYGVITPTAGQLVTGGFLTLVSTTTTGGGAIGDATANTGNASNYISGNVNIQRYTQAQRGYRTLGNPLNADLALSQLTDNFVITGLVGSSATVPNTAPYGTSSSNPSAFIYEPTTIAPTSPLIRQTSESATNWSKGKGLYVFIRGNGNEGNLAGTGAAKYSGGIISPVTIDVNGTVNQGQTDVAIGYSSTIGANNYNLIANPYPSAINLQNVVLSDASTLASNYGFVYTYNPMQGVSSSTTAVGGFTTISTSGNPSIIIPSMGAFYVLATAAKTIRFQEAAKTTTAPSLGLFGTGNTNPRFRLNISAGSTSFDDLQIGYNTISSSQSGDFYDAPKLNNTALDFYSLSADNKQLAIDYRNIGSTDIIPLGINTNTLNNYTISLSELTDLPNTQVVLRDKLLNKETILSQVGDSYNFDITADTATKGENRFEIGLLGTTVLPTLLTDFNAQLQSNNTVAVNWVSATEVNLAKYNVQRSKDGTNFSTVGTVAAKGASAYSYSDDLSAIISQLSTVYYRLQSVDKDASSTYSKIVALPLGSSNKAGLSIFPNPVKATLFAQVTVTKAGPVEILITDMQGKLLGKQTTQVAAGTTAVSVNTANLAGGSYVLVINGADGTQKQQFVKE